MFEHAALGGISDNDHPLSRVCITDSERLDMPRQALHGERVACVATPPICSTMLKAGRVASSKPARAPVLAIRSHGRYPMGTIVVVQFAFSSAIRPFVISIARKGQSAS
jgi:hypothetical protein